MRHMWTLFEPIHDVTYFHPAARAAFEEAGLRGFWRGYFAGRAAPLGPVPAAPVIAAFFGFAPHMVARALPDVWTRATPERTLAARLRGAVDALRPLAPPAASAPRGGGGPPPRASTGPSRSRRRPTSSPPYRGMVWAPNGPPAWPTCCTRSRWPATTHFPRPPRSACRYRQGVADRVPTRVAVSVALGTLLNPLNSSMIAVGLVALQGEFHVSLATSTWLISAFYLAASVGQPVMGRLADPYGPRRVFTAGLALVGATGILVLFAPGFGWVVAARVLQAIGTSVGFPAGLALIRRLAGGRPPASTLGVLSAANSASAAFGPVLGGVLVAAFGWRGIFAVNIPLAATGLLLARRWLPAHPPARPAASVAPGPFLDLRGLLGHPALIGGLGLQVAVPCVVYLVVLGPPQWLGPIR